MVMRQERVVSGNQIAVGVNGRRGRVRVRARRLLNAESDGAAQRLVHCVLQDDSVFEVRAYCAQDCIEIFFDQQSVSAPQLLTRLAEQLTDLKSDSRNAHWTVPGCLTEPIGSGFRLRKMDLEWTVAASKPGLLYASHPELCAQRKLRLQFAERLAECDSIRRATAGWYRPTIEVRYEPSRLTPADVARLLRQLTAETLHIEDDQLSTLLQAELSHGIRRRIYRALAVSNLGLTFAALATPVVPTPPFLIAAIYFAIRSSNHLQRWLEETWMLGRLAHEWQNYHAVRGVVKLETIAITVVVTGAFVLMFEMAPAQLAAVGVITAAEIAAVVLLPSLKLTRLPEPTSPALLDQPQFPVPAIA
ncbi:MAG: DUF454 family protein [Pirellulales bacterium]